MQLTPSVTHATPVAVGLILGLAAASAGLDASPAAGEQTPAVDAATAYRVDMVVDADGERTVMRKYVDGDRSRTELEYEGETIVTIELGDATRTTYTIMPSMKRVMKSTQPQDTAPAPDANSAAAATPDAADDGLALVGTETIEGRLTEKYRVDGPGGEGLIWVDPSTQLPVRMEAGGARVDMQNYDLSRPAPELFEIPKGYEIMDLDRLRTRFNPALMVAGGMAGAYAAQTGENLGGNLGASVGGAFGPLGSMIGKFLGQKLGKAGAQKAVATIIN